MSPLCSRLQFRLSQQVVHECFFGLFRNRMDCRSIARAALDTLR